MSKEIEKVETEIMEETEKKGILSKIGGFIKKHGKKIVAGAAIVGGAMVAYKLGKKSNDEVDYIEVPAEDLVFEDELVEAE